MKAYQWGLLGLGAAIIVAGLGAALVYFLKTSSQLQFDAYRKHGDSLATVQAQALRMAQDSLLERVGVLVQSGNVHASQGQQRDTVVKLDSGAVSDLRQSLAQARTSLDSLLRYPPLVSADSTQIVDLTGSRNSWRSAFTDQAQANAALAQAFRADTMFRDTLLRHIEALPKPPRTGVLAWLLHPKPYLKAGYRNRGFVEAGACFGC